MLKNFAGFKEKYVIKKIQQNQRHLFSHEILRYFSEEISLEHLRTTVSRIFRLKQKSVSANIYHGSITQTYT